MYVCMYKKIYTHINYFLDVLYIGYRKRVFAGVGYRVKPSINCIYQVTGFLVKRKSKGVVFNE